MIFSNLCSRPLVVFAVGISVGIVISLFTVIVLHEPEPSRKIVVRVCDDFKGNTNIVYRNLYDCNELLKSNFKKEGRFAWRDSMWDLNSYLNVPENMCSWDTYVVDSNSYELFVVQSDLDSHKRFYLLTKERVYDIELVPLTFEFDTLRRRCD